MRLENQIRAKLTEAFQPERFVVTNESSRHQMDPQGETHFRVLLVSPWFEGKSAVERHRAVFGTLAEEMAGGIHALTLELRTPAEWKADAQRVSSPACRTKS